MPKHDFPLLPPLAPFGKNCRAGATRDVTRLATKPPAATTRRSPRRLGGRRVFRGASHGFWAT